MKNRKRLGGVNIRIKYLIKRCVYRIGYLVRRVFGLSRWYPNSIYAGEFQGVFDRRTIAFLKSPKCNLPSRSEDIAIAEIGIWKGATSLEFARHLDHQGQLHLFDFVDKVRKVKSDLKSLGFENAITWGSSYKYLDSYNWSLMKLWAQKKAPMFDYIYLDGAHTWAIDALSFFLCDLLIKPGGYIDFDDYNWRLRGSGLDPERVPETNLLYTEEQIDSQQVKLIVDLLVRRNSSYEEVIENKIFRKKVLSV